jgi:hypothetical protein
MTLGFDLARGPETETAKQGRWRALLLRFGSKDAQRAIADYER